jgi:hypothetical protein
METGVFFQAMENLLHEPGFAGLARGPDGEIMAAFLGILADQLNIGFFD